MSFESFEEAIKTLNQVVAPSVFIVMNSVTLFFSLLFLIQLIIWKSKSIFNGKKIDGLSSENQGITLRCLTFILFYDILLALSSIGYSAWELAGYFVPAFQPDESNLYNTKSAYWIYFRILRILGLVGFTTSYGSGVWTVCFAVILYLTLRAGRRPIRHKLLWEATFHFFGNVVTIFVFIVWASYRTITTETYFFEKHPNIDGFFLGCFYSLNIISTVILFSIDLFVCALIWCFASRSIRRHRGSESEAKRKARRSEWRLFFRLSLFLVPWLFLGSSNMVWFFMQAYEAFTKKPFISATFVELFLIFHSTIEPLKGTCNALIYGLNLHRWDRNIIACCLRLKPRRVESSSSPSNESYTAFDDSHYAHQGDSIPLKSKTYDLHEDMGTPEEDSILNHPQEPDTDLEGTFIVEMKD